MTEDPVDERRVTEIGGWEHVDRAHHPLVAALGVLGLLAVFVVGLIGLGVAVRDGDRRVEVARVLVPSVVGASEDAARETMEDVGLLVEGAGGPQRASRCRHRVRAGSHTWCSSRGRLCGDDQRLDGTGGGDGARCRRTAGDRGSAAVGRHRADGPHRRGTR
ncbi:MAG: hypothetical protein M5U19_00090 [Microthrixaceae bacterium]|nr:hypothetical protein [Microthrixaceae bacterium]